MATAPFATTFTTHTALRDRVDREVPIQHYTTSDHRIYDSTHQPALRRTLSQTQRLHQSPPGVASSISQLDDNRNKPEPSNTTEINRGSPAGSPREYSGNSASGSSRNTSRDWDKHISIRTRTRPRANSGDGSLHSPRFLRTSTSIPDYRTINAAYRKTSAPLSRTETASKVRNDGLSVPTNPLISINDAGADSLRGSLRSALTNGSSAADWTERSSVWTDRSSTSEVGGHQSNWPLVQDVDMSVEDTIALYAEGFVDDPVIDELAVQNRGKPFTSSPLALNSRNNAVSSRHNAASFAPPSALLKPFAHARASVSAQPDVGMSTLTVPAHDTATTPLEDRLKALIGPPRDRYGFKKESQHVKLAQYDIWNANYTKYLERRRKKWLVLMKQHKLSTDNPKRFPPKSEKVKRYIRKGIPPDWRGQAWFFYAGGPARLVKYSGLYTNLLSRVEKGGLSESDRDHIERDLFRTFPDHIKFKPNESPHTKDPTSNHAPTHEHRIETTMIISLRRVLQAFAIYEPKIGYCQSLNFLAGYFLIFLSGDEEKAFHLLCILTSKHLPGTHGVSLEGANIDIGVFMLCLRDAMPSLWTDKIDDRADTTVQLAAGDMRVTTGLPTVSLATTGWFMSCFSSTLPVETTCRVWDCLFYEGSKTLFRVGLAIFKLSERDIRATGDESMEVFQVVQTLPKGMLDANLVIETATKKGGGWSIGGGAGGFGGLSQKVVEKRREEKRSLYKVERERVLMKALTMPVDEGVLVEKGRKSVERRRVRRLVSLRGK